MRRFAAIFLCLLWGAALSGANVYWKDSPVGIASPVDELLAANWKKHSLPVPCEASDCVMVRRLYLDLAGRLPTPQEAQSYVYGKDPEKFQKLVDKLLWSDDFADYWTMHWCDALRVKSEFPINLWPNAVYGYWRYIRQFVRGNRPYNNFVTSLLTSKGSNFRVPEANFYRAVANRTPEGIAGAIALTFLGSRLNRWQASDQKAFIALFEPVRFKSTREWKEEIVYWTTPGAEQKAAAFVTEHPDFAPALVNRVWAWIFGSGIVEPADDMRKDNPPSNPELLAELTKEFVASKYNVKKLIRTVCLSAAYRSAGTGSAAAEKQFAAYPIRRLDAEVIDDAIRDISATESDFSSVIPEPFTFLPGQMRAINVADGSISSSFLILFGRPARDVGTFEERNNAITGKQRLQLYNSGNIYSRMGSIFWGKNKGNNGKGAGKGLGKGKGNGKGKGRVSVPGRETWNKLSMAQRVDLLYWLFFSRPPTQEERSLINAEIQSLPNRQRNRFAQDLAWILLNTKEFLHRH